MNTRDLPPELQALANDQQEALPERTRDNRSGRMPSGGGRFATKRTHNRDDDADNIIQIPTGEEKRFVKGENTSETLLPIFFFYIILIFSKRYQEYPRPVQVYGGEDEMPPFSMPTYPPNQVGLNMFFIFKFVLLDVSLLEKARSFRPFSGTV